jgi:hypothetical protein
METTTTIALFKDMPSAEQAINDLRDFGIADADISYVYSSEGRVIEEDGKGDVAGGAASGAATGTVLGAIAGVAVAAGVLPGLHWLGHLVLLGQQLPRLQGQ